MTVTNRSVWQHSFLLLREPVDLNCSLQSPNFHQRVILQAHTAGVRRWLGSLWIKQSFQNTPETRSLCRHVYKLFLVGTTTGREGVLRHKIRLLIIIRLLMSRVLNSETACGVQSCQERFPLFSQFNQIDWHIYCYSGYHITIHDSNLLPSTSYVSHRETHGATCMHALRSHQQLPRLLYYTVFYCRGSL